MQFFPFQASLGTVLCTENSPENNVSPSKCSVIPIAKFSSFSKLLRVTAYVRRFIDNLKSKIQKVPVKFTKFSSVCITAEEMIYAEKCLVICEQRVYFPEVFEYFENKGSLPAIVKNLNLKIVDSVIRCFGRIEHSDLEYDAKFPILLPGKSSFTKLLINFIHRKCLHGGVNSNK